MNHYALEETGIYFRQGDVEDLRGQLQRALDDPNWLRERGAAQQAHVARTYSWDQVVRSHVALFGER